MCDSLHLIQEKPSTEAEPILCKWCGRALNAIIMWYYGGGDDDNDDDDDGNGLVGSHKRSPPLR